MKRRIGQVKRVREELWEHRGELAEAHREMGRLHKLSLHPQLGLWRDYGDPEDNSAGGGSRRGSVAGSLTGGGNGG